MNINPLEHKTITMMNLFSHNHNKILNQYQLQSEMNFNQPPQTITHQPSQTLSRLHIHNIIRPRA